MARRKSFNQIQAQSLRIQARLNRQMANASPSRRQQLVARSNRVLETEDRYYRNIDSATNGSLSNSMSAWGTQYPRATYANAQSPYNTRAIQNYLRERDTDWNPATDPRINRNETASKGLSSH